MVWTPAMAVWMGCLGRGGLLSLASPFAFSGSGLRDFHPGPSAARESHHTLAAPPPLLCPSEVPDGLVQGSQARFTPCSILPTSGPWGARRRAWQGGRWWVGRRGCPADGRLSGQMANWVGVRSSPICFCPCRAFLSTFSRVRMVHLTHPGSSVSDSVLEFPACLPLGSHGPSRQPAWPGLSALEGIFRTLGKPWLSMWHSPGQRRCGR